MHTFGDRLRSEREERGLSIPAVATILGVDERRLEALERNAFNELPENPEMVDCLRGYADCLEVEADLMIEDYVREREACLSKLDQAIEAAAPPARHEAVASTPSIPAPAREVPSSELPTAIAGTPGIPTNAATGTTTKIALVAIIATIAVAGWWMLSGDDATPKTEVQARPAPAAVDASPVPPAPVERTTLPATPPARVNPPVTAPVTSPAASPVTAAPASESSATIGSPAEGIQVAEHAVGTGLRERELTGVGQRFGLGDAVLFWNDVRGGTAGDRIEHVWLLDGAVQATVSLDIGGSRWRTHSRKSLRSAGNWTVEARDVTGQVLARSQFEVTP